MVRVDKWLGLFLALTDAAISSAHDSHDFQGVRRKWAHYNPVWLLAAPLPTLDDETS